MPLQKLTADELKAKRKQRDAAYYARNRDTILLQKAQYYAENRGLILAKVHTYREQNPDKIAEAKRKYLSRHYEQMQSAWVRYAAVHAEQKRAAAAKWYRENTARAKIQRLRWARLNVDKVNATNRASYARNPKAALVRWHNREARKRAQGGRLSKDLASRLYMQQNGLCACCGTPLGADYHMDHIMPLRLGGAHTDSNIQLLTKRCNLMKASKHPMLFMRLRAEQLCPSKN